MKAHGIHLWGSHRWSLWFLLIDAYTPTRQRHVQRAQVRTLGPDFILEISKILWKFQNEYIFVPTLFSRGAGSGHRWGQPGIEWWCGFSLILQYYQLSYMTMVRMRQLTGLSLSSVGTTSCVATGGGALWTGPMSAMRSGLAMMLMMMSLSYVNSKRGEGWHPQNRNRSCSDSQLGQNILMLCNTTDHARKQNGSFDATDPRCCCWQSQISIGLPSDKSWWAIGVPRGTLWPLEEETSRLLIFCIRADILKV